MKQKILFICKDRNYGSYHEGKYGLYNSASFVMDELIKNGYESKIVSVFDANCIDREVTNYKPDVVILEAIWVPPAKLQELVKIRRHQHIKWIVRIHSKSTFLANEGIAMDWINQYVKITNVSISANNRDFNNELVALDYNSVYLPNVYNISYKFEYLRKDERYLDIGCFGSLRPMKNHLQQAIAAMRFADYLDKPMNFHINSSRYEQNGNNVLKNLRALFAASQRHSLIEHKWLSHHDFCRLVATMDMGMQVSLSESFNIVTADFVQHNVPVVACSDITFVAPMFRAVQTNGDSILRAMIIAWYGSYVNLQYINKIMLKRHNNISSRIWLNHLEDMSRAACTGNCDTSCTKPCCGPITK